MIIVFISKPVKLLGEGTDKTIVDGIIVDMDVSNLAIGLKKLRFNEFIFGRGTIAGPFNEQNIIEECSTTHIQLAHGSGIPVNDTTPGPIYSFLIRNNDLGTGGSMEFFQGQGAAINME